MRPIAQTLTGYVTPLYDWYRRLSLRERVLIALSMLFLTWAVWEATLGGFLLDARKQISRDVNVVYDRLQAAVQEQSALQEAKSRDPNVRLAAERKRLDEELRSLDASIGSVLDRFVTPERMPRVLEDVIRHHQGLRLRRMISLPVEPMELLPADGDAADGPGPPLIYRHPLRLELEGNYFDVLAYLNELEEGPWRFGWRQLDYEVSEYPLAEVTLEIETLSREKSWIGV